MHPPHQERLVGNRGREEYGCDAGVRGSTVMGIQLMAAGVHT